VAAFVIGTLCIPFLTSTIGVCVEKGNTRVTQLELTLLSLANTRSYTVLSFTEINFRCSSGAYSLWVLINMSKFGYVQRDRLKDPSNVGGNVLKYH
jgi:hypothetical protein